jgi:hypothetical protein
MNAGWHRVAALVVLGLVGTGAPARADTTVPLDVQAELLCKVLRFERGLVERAGPEIHMILVDLPGNPKSGHAAKQLTQALGHAQVAGKKVRVIRHHYTSPDELKRAIVSERAQVAILTPGFAAQLPRIAAGLVGIRVITMSTDADLVPLGVVLGFELVSSRPKIAINLTRAKQQNLDFNSDLFRLAKVFK